MDYLKLIFLLLLSGACQANKEIPSLYYTQQVQGTALHTTINTVSGIPLPTMAHDMALNEFVGTFFDVTDGSLYYSYQVQLPVGQNVIVPVTVRQKVSYDSLGDLMVYFALNPSLYASNDYFYWVTDFFFPPAEANPVLVGVAIQVLIGFVLEAAKIAIVDAFFSDQVQAPPSYIASCTKPNIDYIMSVGPYGTGCSLPGMHIVCIGSAASCRYDGDSYGLTSGAVSSSPISNGGASNKIATMFKQNITHPTPAGPGKIGKALGIGAEVADFLKNVYDAYKAQHGTSPTGTKPGGGAKMPDDKSHYEKDWGDKPDADIEPPDLSKDTQTEAPPEKDLGTKTETKPDGSQTKTEEKLDIKNGIGGEIITEIISRIIDFGPGGEVTGDTTTHSTPSPSSEPAVDYCKEHSDIIGCSKWGEPEAPDTIETHEMDIDIDPGSAPPGSCPPDKTLHLSLGDITFSYEPVCQAAGYINPIMVTLAWLTAGFVLFGVVKD